MRLSAFLASMSDVEVRLHPRFQEWLERLAEVGDQQGSNPGDRLQVLAEIMALINALERHGRELGDPECHPVVTARYDLHALRRTPPSAAAPYADSPPVLRILFGYVSDGAGREIAVVVVGGDKTRLGNRWYPANVARAQDRIDEWCRRNPGYTPTIRRGDL